MIDTLIREISGLDKIELPKNKAETKRLRHTLENASEDNPVRIFVGSCPDYSHKNGLYTHKSVGTGVPLLTMVHLYNDAQLLDVLDREQVPFRYTVMLADVEATDELFCAKFTEGSEDEFLRRCYQSVLQTQELSDEMFSRYSHGSIHSSSFFGEFGREKFLFYQQAYQELLHRQYMDISSSFRVRVEDDLAHRMNLYRTMYPEMFAGFRLIEGGEKFIVGRTIRTMAQYLTLGRLIGGVSDGVVIINHPTRNNSMFNARNKFLLPDKGLQPQPTIPILELKQEVYK